MKNMILYLAADHRGFELKNILKGYIKTSLGLEVIDMGASSLKPEDDYVDYAEVACRNIIRNPRESKAVFICGSGHGMDMVANKYRGIRAALGFNEKVAKQSREHEDTNVLVLASDWVKPDEAKKIVRVWLDTPYSGEDRHTRRLAKLEKIEKANFS